MYVWTYITLIGFATLWTYVYWVQREPGVSFFAALIAAGTWFILAFGGGVLEATSGGEVLTIDPGAAPQLLFVALAMFSVWAAFEEKTAGFLSETTDEAGIGTEDPFR